MDVQVLHLKQIVILQVYIVNILEFPLNLQKLA